MNTPSNQQPVQGIASAFLRWKWIWIASTAICTVGGLLYVRIGQPRQWTATQRLIIDDDFANELSDFANNWEFLDSAAKQASLKFSQDHNVAIDDSKVNLRPASHPVEGSEVYRRIRTISVQVSANTKQQAVELSNGVCTATETRLREAMHGRLDEEAFDHEASAQTVASQLETTEKLLAELPRRAQQELGGAAKDVVWSTGDSGLKRRLDRIRANADHLEEQRLELQHECRRTKQFLDNPAGLLEQRVSERDRNAKLKELRVGWATSLMQVTELQSRYTEAHPLLIAARETERSLAAQVHAELEKSSVVLEEELATNQADIAALEEEQAEVQLAMGQLKTYLDQYADAVEFSKQKRVELRAVESELAASLAKRESVDSVNLVSTPDAPSLAALEPEVDGTTVVAGATLSGLILGFGLIFLFKPLVTDLKRNSMEVPSESESASETETLSRAYEAGDDFESQEESLLNELAATVTELRIAEETNVMDQDMRSEAESKEVEAEPQQAPAELVGAGSMKFSDEANSPPQPK